jgi:exopolysaccharide production protein ExoQ
MTNLFVSCMFFVSLAAFSGTGRGLIYNPLVVGAGHDPTAALYTGAKILITIVLAAIMLLTPGHLRMAAKMFRPMIPYTLLGLLSLSWAVSPDVSFRSCVNLIAFLIVVGATVPRLGIEATFNIALRYAIFVVILCLMVSLIFPQVGLHGQQDLFQAVHAGKWRGVFLHKNQLGAFSALTLILLVFRSQTHGISRYLLVMAVVAGALTLTFSGSASPIAALMVLILIYTYLGPGRTSLAVKYSRKFIVSVLVILMLLAIPAILTLLSRDISLTGRTFLWTITFQQFLHYPLFGHGFGLGRSGLIPPFTNPDLGIGDVHSAYLNQMLDLGLVGLLLLIWLLVGSIRACLRALYVGGADRKMTKGLMCLIIFASVLGGVEVLPFQIDGAIGPIVFLAILMSYQLRAPLFSNHSDYNITSTADLPAYRNDANTPSTDNPISVAHLT